MKFSKKMQNINTYVVLHGLLCMSCCECCLYMLHGLSCWLASIYSLKNITICITLFSFRRLFARSIYGLAQLFHIFALFVLLLIMLTVLLTLH